MEWGNIRRRLAGFSAIFVVFSYLRLSIYMVKSLLRKAPFFEINDILLMLRVSSDMLSAIRTGRGGARYLGTVPQAR